MPYYSNYSDYLFYAPHGPGFWLIGNLLYFLPAIIAFARGHHNRIAIFIVNFLFGWSGIGWIIAFIWSLSAVPYWRVWGPGPPGPRW